MVKNEKIQKFLEEKGDGTTMAFLGFLHFFVDHFDEFREVLEARDRFSFGDGMKKYDRLSSYLHQEYEIVWKNGERLSADFVRNLYKLARRENEVLDYGDRRRRVRPEHDTVFRIFHPSDLEDEPEAETPMSPDQDQTCANASEW